MSSRHSPGMTPSDLIARFQHCRGTYPEDGGNKFAGNVGNNPADCVVSWAPLCLHISLSLGYRYRMVGGDATYWCHYLKGFMARWPGVSSRPHDRNLRVETHGFFVISIVEVWRVTNI